MGTSESSLDRALAFSDGGVGQCLNTGLDTATYPVKDSADEVEGLKNSVIDGTPAKPYRAFLTETVNISGFGLKSRAIFFNMDRPAAGESLSTAGVLTSPADLDTVSDWFKRYTQTFAFKALSRLNVQQQVVIDGGCSTEGLDDYNLELSRRRADMVTAWIKQAQSGLVEKFSWNAKGHGTKLAQGKDDPKDRFARVNVGLVGDVSSSVVLGLTLTGPADIKLVVTVDGVYSISSKGQDDEMDFSGPRALRESYISAVTRMIDRLAKLAPTQKYNDPAVKTATIEEIRRFRSVFDSLLQAPPFKNDGES